MHRLPPPPPQKKDKKKQKKKKKKEEEQKTKHFDWLQKVYIYKNNHELRMSLQFMRLVMERKKTR